MNEHNSNRDTDSLSFDVLPDDIIEQVLRHVSPLDNLSGLQTLSRRLQRLANQPLLWRDHCLTTFQYWRPQHAFKTLLKGRASATDWKALFLIRQRQNAAITRIFDRIVTTRVDRVARMQQICAHGYDAKDFLLLKCRSRDNDPNVLAVRYHAGAILGSIHRSIAVQQWLQVHYPDPMYPLNTQTRVERSLAAFDLFVLHDQHGDIDETIQLLDIYATAFTKTQPEWSKKSTRQKALALNQWMRAINLVGLNDQEDFRNLRNCFIGQALRDVNHESIPLISCAIYCGIAERVGLRAECFLPPICAHVVITAPAGLDLDANPSNDEHQMYLNPFEADSEVPLQYLERLALYANTTISRLRCSGNVAVAAAAKRTARSIEDAHDSAANFADPLVSGALLRGHPATNLQLALYAARWALLLLSPPRSDDGDTRFMRVMKDIRNNWPVDEWIMAQHLQALHNKGIVRGTLDTNLLRTQPDEHLVTNPHCRLTAERVAPFRLGQVFIHRRYQWLGAIVGFYEAPSASYVMLDAGSEGTGSWPRKFYIRTITASDLTEQIISSDNLQVGDSFRVTEDMFPLAGKYFKRFDPVAGCFISNVDELYPWFAVSRSSMQAL